MAAEKWFLNYDDADLSTGLKQHLQELFPEKSFFEQRCFVAIPKQYPHQNNTNKAPPEGWHFCKDGVTFMAQSMSLNEFPPPRENVPCQVQVPEICHPRRARPPSRAHRQHRANPLNRVLRQRPVIPRHRLHPSRSLQVLPRPQILLHPLQSRQTRPQVLRQLNWRIQVRHRPAVHRRHLPEITGHLPRLPSGVKVHRWVAPIRAIPARSVAIQFGSSTDNCVLK